jgi:hypothetical protein
VAGTAEDVELESTTRQQEIIPLHLIEISMIQPANPGKDPTSQSGKRSNQSIREKIQPVNPGKDTSGEGTKS